MKAFKCDKMNCTDCPFLRTVAKLFLNNLYGKLVSSTSSNYKIAIADEKGDFNMKTSKKLMKAISTIANFKCDKMNCTDCPFLRTVKDTDICLSADMKTIQLSLLIEQSEKR